MCRITIKYPGSKNLIFIQFNVIYDELLVQERERERALTQLHNAISTKCQIYFH